MAGAANTCRGRRPLAVATAIVSVCLSSRAQSQCTVSSNNPRGWSSVSIEYLDPASQNLAPAAGLARLLWNTFCSGIGGFPQIRLESVADQKVYLQFMPGSDPGDACADYMGPLNEHNPTGVYRIRV
ncbi:MAG: hypothetical protein HRF46_12485 [Acidobacteriota bacterium]|jgi:hypothetical protein